MGSELRISYGGAKHVVLCTDYDATTNKVTLVYNRGCDNEEFELINLNTDVKRHEWKVLPKKRKAEASLPEYDTAKMDQRVEEATTLSELAQIRTEIDNEEQRILAELAQIEAEAEAPQSAAVAAEPIA